MATQRYFGPIDTVLDAHSARVSLWALCRNCGRTKLVDPWGLIKKLGSAESKRLTDLGKHFKCTGCGCHLTTLIPAEGILHVWARTER